MADKKRMEFQAPDYAGAVKKAEKHFKVKKESLEIKKLASTKKSGFLGSKKMVKISVTKKKKIVKKEVEKEKVIVVEKGPYFDRSDFILDYTDDGICLGLIKNADPLDPLRRQEIIDYINKKYIKDLNSDLLIPILTGRVIKSQDEINKQKELDDANISNNDKDKPKEDDNKLTIIAPAQEEKYARAKVSVSTIDNDHEGFINLSHPDEKGEHRTKDEILEALHSNEIVFGILDEKIDEFIKNPVYAQDYLVAQGTLPQDGDDASLEVLFKTEHEGKATETEHGKVDFWDLDLYESAHEGQVLLQKTPLEKGIDGQTVKGNILGARDGKDVHIFAGKNTAISKDELTLTATVAGRVEYNNDRVDVFTELNIESDVDLSVGNLDFDGYIKIKGDVISGITINATGSIFIGGSVAAAKIHSDNDITIKGGMNSGDKGSITAGGNVCARFLEQTQVNAKGTVSAGYILDCDIIAGNAVEAVQGRGLILGGNICAGKYISALEIGNTYNIITYVELGVPVERCDELHEEITKINEKSQSIKPLLEALTANPDAIPKEKAEQLMQTLVSDKELIKKHEAEIASIFEARRYAINHGKVHVFKLIYPGTVVVMGEDINKIQKTNRFCSYKKYNGKVTFSECELPLDSIK